MPRFFAPPASAADWMDRSPLTITRGFTGNIQNDTTGTVRWTYTVPAGRRIQIGALHGDGEIDGVLGGNSMRLTAVITPSGESGFAIFRNNITASVGRSSQVDPAGYNFFLNAGDKIELTSVTIGATTVFATATGFTGTEFDA